MLDLISLVSCFVLGIIGWFTYEVYIFPFYISPLRKIPGPSSDNPFYGNIMRLILEEPGESQFKWVKQYGNVTKYYGIFNRPTVLVTDTKIIQEIVSNKAYDFLKPTNMLADLLAIIGKGLVLVEGETHKRQRKMMNPAFSHNNIKEMVPTFVRVASTLKGIIEDKIDKVDKSESKIILTPYISKATLDIIGLVGFNYEFNSLTSQNELADAYGSIMNYPMSIVPIFISILSNYVPFIRKIPISINRQFNNAIKVIERVSENLVKERSEKNELKGNDLLSLLININKSLPVEEKMTDEELKYQIMTFLAAGHDTTSVATSWGLYFLSQNLHEQDLLREELVKAFPDKSKINPTFDEINSLEYLNCIVKETLRLIPPVRGIGRCNAEDTVLGGYFIPKNTPISIPIGTIHVLPSIWGPTANNFDPKRWLDPSLTKFVTNFNYIPFITGTRSCIGSKLATTEFKILLSTLIRNFVFKQVEGFHIKKKFGLITKPDPHLELMVSKTEV